MKDILENSTLHDVLITNLELDVEAQMYATADTVGIPHLRSLILENVSNEAMDLFARFEFYNLHELVVTSADGSFYDPGEWGFLRNAFGNVKTAKLEVQDPSMAEAFISGLRDVKNLELSSDNTSILPEALKISSDLNCTNLESIVFHHPVTFDAVEEVAHRRPKTLKFIGVPLSFKVPRGSSFEDIPKPVERMTLGRGQPASAWRL
jgi:hypothetical protein